MDVARGIAVFLLAWVHSVWIYWQPGQQTGELAALCIEFLGKNTAAFLLLMGLSLALARPKKPIQHLWRGLGLLALGYGMNILKFWVPIEVFGTMPAEFVAAYGWTLPLTSSEMATLVLLGDILQLVGLSLWVFALIQWRTERPWVYLLLALVIALVSSELRGLSLGVPVMDYGLDLLFAEGYNVYFPLFPWAVPIFVGFYLGAKFRQNETSSQDREAALYRQGLKLGAGLIFVGGGLCWYDAKYHMGDFFHTGPGGILLLSGLNLPILWALNLWVKRHVNAWWVRGLSYLSCHVTAFYVIQWVLIYWFMAFFGYHQQNTVNTLMIGGFMFVLTLIVLRLWLMLKDFGVQRLGVSSIPAVKS